MVAQFKELTSTDQIIIALGLDGLPLKENFEDGMVVCSWKYSFMDYSYCVCYKVNFIQ